MSFIAGEMGLRLQGLIGLDRQHPTPIDNVCLVVREKGSNGSGHRKRQVTMTPLAKATLQEFLTFLPRGKLDPLFQNQKGQRLSINTAHHWMDELIAEIRQAELPIFIDKGFGWHALRRTFATRHL